VGGDYWTVGRSWVSVTPLGLFQDYALSKEHLMRGRGFVSVVADIVKDAASDAELSAGGTEVPQIGVASL
jgi:hypothetical protein